MPKIDFQSIEDVDDFSPLEPGRYLCRLAEVKEEKTQFGDEMWKLRWVVTEGPYQRRHIFDNMVFSEAALKRVKLICSSLGLDMSSEVDLTPDLIKDKACYVSVDIDEYEDSEGKAKFTNIVPFAGYEPASEEEDDESIPF